MANSKVPDTLIFKALMREIHEYIPYHSGVNALEEMCKDNSVLSEVCELYHFYHDDGKINEEEAFLLDWVKTMEQKPADELRALLRQTALKIPAKSY